MSKRETGPGAAPKGGVPSFKVGAAGMLICFGLVLASVIGLAVVSSGSGDSPPVDGQGVTKPTLKPIGEGALVIELPEDARRKLEGELLGWFRADDRKPIYDGQADDEQEWVEKLTSSSIWQRLQALPEFVHGRLENVPKVLNEPGPFRGTTVRVWGMVEELTTSELTLASGARPVWRARLVDGSGVSWTVTGFQPPPDDVKIGSWVKGYGVFTKLWPVEGSTARALHVLLSRPLVPSFEPVQHREPLTEWAASIIDGNSSEPRARDLEERPLYGMLNYVRTLGPQGYEELRDTDAIPIQDLETTLPLVKNPDKYRFQAVRVRMAFEPGRFATDGNIPENPGNIGAVYQGHLLDGQSRVVYFVSPFPKAAFDLGTARQADVEGFFLKRMWTQPASNKKPYWMPVLIGTAMTPVHVESNSIPLPVIMAILGIGSVIVFVFFLWMLYRGRQQREAFKERWEERQRKHPRVGSR